jgi:hypothetical protein
MMGMLSISRKWVVLLPELAVGFCVEVGFGVFVGTGLACVFVNSAVGEAVEIG